MRFFFIVHGFKNGFNLNLQRQILHLREQRIALLGQGCAIVAIMYPQKKSKIGGSTRSKNSKTQYEYQSGVKKYRRDHLLWKIHQGPGGTGQPDRSRGAAAPKRRTSSPIRQREAVGERPQCHRPREPVVRPRCRTGRVRAQFCAPALWAEFLRGDAPAAGRGWAASPACRRSQTETGAEAFRAARVRRNNAAGVWVPAGAAKDRPWSPLCICQSQAHL